MADITVNIPIKEMQMDGVIIRCGCSEAMKADANWHGKPNQPCPNPLREEHRQLAYWHKNPARRLANWLDQRLNVWSYK